MVLKPRNTNIDHNDYAKNVTDVQENYMEKVAQLNTLIVDDIARNSNSEFLYFMEMHVLNS